jgi:hypothetical protein
MDTTNHNIYVCKSAANGAAVWYKQAAHNNFAAGAAPTVDDDLDLYYAPGSIWLDTTAHNVYICESAANGAAVWKLVNSSSGVLLANGTVPLTANWDAGAYKITADTFTSDVAIGTAPFTSTSTTTCTNVSADLLDVYHESTFAALVGRNGGQTLYGGTAASNNLTLQATSDATPGGIIMPTANLSLGTKATTASAFALAIHEGAAAAPNKIVFLDADGSTAVGALWKTTGDSMVLSAGDATTETLKITSGGSLSTTGSITAGAGGVAATNAAFSGGKTTGVDDTSGSYGLSLTSRPSFTKDQTSTCYNIYSAVFPECDNGKTNSGNIYSFYTECMRNHNAAGTDDYGTITGIYAQQAFFGHYNLNTSATPLTTYCSGVRVSPYYVTGTISNLYAIEVSAPSTGGTVTNGWSMYNAYNGNTYWAATYNRFQSTTGDRIIYCVQTSTTDPIADAWNTHSNEKYKNDLGPIDSDIDRSARYQARKAIADRTLHTWTRKVELDREHYEGMFPLEDDRPRGLPGEEIPAKDLEVRQAEQDLAIYRHIEKCKTLKKFQKKQYGMFAEETPEEITSYGLDGQPEGIDLGAYIGWVHRAVDAMQYDLDFLEVDVADIDNILWLMDSDMYFINEALIIAEEKIKILEEKNTELESKNDALLRKHEDYERRMALLEERLAKLEIQ